MYKRNNTHVDPLFPYTIYSYKYMLNSIGTVELCQRSKVVDLDWVSAATATFDANRTLKLNDFKRYVSSDDER